MILGHTVKIQKVTKLALKNKYRHNSIPPIYLHNTIPGSIGRKFRNLCKRDKIEMASEHI